MWRLAQNRRAAGVVYLLAGALVAACGRPQAAAPIVGTELATETIMPAKETSTSQPGATTEIGGSGGATVGPVAIPSLIQLPTLEATATNDADLDMVTSTPPPVSTPLSGGAAAYPEYGHDPNWTWISGEFQHTQIQGGCDYLVYDATKSNFEDRVSLVGAVEGLKTGDLIVVFGRWQTGPRVMCPGQQYVAAQVLRR